VLDALCQVLAIWLLTWLWGQILTSPPPW